MALENDNPMVLKLRSLFDEKGESLMPGELLLPEIRWLIDCTLLSPVDRRFAEMRFLQGMKAKDIMEALEWYSMKTFTKHNKKVWARLLQTLRRLVY